MKFTGTALAVAALALLGACSSSTHDAAGSGTPPPHSTVPASSPASQSAVRTVTVTASPPTASSSPSSSPLTSQAVPPSSSAPPPPQTTCTSIKVLVIPGGASPGQEIAALQFVNTGTTKCMLAGYPTVMLLRDGKRIGDPSQPATDRPSSRTLKPGAIAESLVHDYTQTCQAPLSDSVKVLIPGTTKSYVRPHFELRACILRVDRLGAPE